MLVYAFIVLCLRKFSYSYCREYKYSEEYPGHRGCHKTNLYCSVIVKECYLLNKVNNKDFI